MSDSFTVVRMDSAKSHPDKKEVAPSNSLEQLAFRLANNLRTETGTETHNHLPARLDQLSTFFEKAYRHFESASKAEGEASGSAEWVLDNYFIIEQALRQIEEGLPADFYRRLPKVNLGGHTPPRIYCLANTLVQFSASHLDIAQLRAFILNFQTVVTLKIGELWALPLFLRLSILEFFAEALASLTDIPLPASHPDLQPASFSETVTTPEMGANDTLVANSILSLRTLATQDWKAFFEATSQVDTVLRSDPAGVYKSMDFEAHNQYRNVIETLALASPIDEVSIARESVRLAQRGDQPRTRHIGYYLVDEGRIVLESQNRISGSAWRSLTPLAVPPRHVCLFKLDCSVDSASLFVRCCLRFCFGGESALYSDSWVLIGLTRLGCGCGSGQLVDCPTLAA